MPRIATGHIQNLINGVSQQPPSVRLPTQLEEQMNGYSTVSSGLRKRPPTLHKAIMSGMPATAAYYHTINRDTTERYQVAFTNGGVTIRALDGTSRTVSFPDGTGYLTSSDPANDFRAITVADYTFFLNRTVAVAQGSATSPTRLPEALLHIVAAQYGRTYKVIINGAVVGQYSTSTSTATPESVVQTQVSTPHIAASLLGEAWSEAVAAGTATATSGNATVTKELDVELPSSDWQLVRYDNVVWIQNKLGNDFSISVESDGEEGVMRAHKDEVTLFSDLPNHGPAGFNIKVVGTKDTAFDDYYVVSQKGNASDAKVVWKEGVAQGVNVALDKSTMPHVLIRNSDGTFTFKESSWDQRSVGDIASIPWPSFVGGTIRELVFDRNRLGFCADENTIFSRSGHFFSFWRETVTEILDTDPIDVGVTYPEVSIIKHAVPYNGDTMLFSDRTIFSLSGDQLLTPKSVNITPLLEFKSDPTVPPVVAGTSIFFTDTDGLVRQLVYDKQGGVRDAPPVNDHCPSYIPAGVTKMFAAPNLNLLGIITAGQPNRIYVYKWLVSQQQKLQSAWSYWDLGAQVLDADFIENDMVVTVKRGSTVCWESLPCNEAFRDVGPELVIHLDRRVTIASGTYDAGTNLTTFTLPYAASGVTAVAAPGGSAPVGRRTTIAGTSGFNVTITGDVHLQPYFFGFVYTSDWTLSRFIAHHMSMMGGESTIEQQGDLTIEQLTMQAMSGYLRVEISQLYRDTYAYEITGAKYGDPRNLVGTPNTLWAPLIMTVMADASEITIHLINDSYLPCSVLNADWVGLLQTPGGR